MSASYQSDSTGTFSSTTSVTTSLPASVSLGDVLLLCVFNNTVANAAVAPEGYSLLENTTGADYNASLFFKVAGPSESAPTFTFGASSSGSWLMMRYNGSAGSPPVQGYSGVYYTPTTNPAQSPFVPSANGCTLIGIWAGRSVTFSAAESSPLATTERVSQTTDGQGNALFVEDVVPPSTTGSVSLTVTTSSGSYVAFQVALAGGMQITNTTKDSYWLGPMRLPASGTLTLDDSTDTALYLLDDSVADAVNTLVQSGMITVASGSTTAPFPRPTGTPSLLHGDGSPQNKAYAPQGSLYLRRDNTGGGYSLLVKTTGVTTNYGWAAVLDPWRGFDQAFGLQASSFPLVLANASAAVTSGTAQAAGVWLNAGTVLTGLMLNVLSAPSGLGDAFVGIYNSSLDRVAVSLTLTSTFDGATGFVKAPFSSPYTVPVTGLYYLADLYATGTMPTFAWFDAGSSAISQVSPSGGYPFFIGPASQTSLGPTITAGATASMHWIGAYT